MAIGGAMKTHRLRRYQGGDVPDVEMFEQAEAEEAGRLLVAHVPFDHFFEAGEAAVQVELLVRFWCDRRSDESGKSSLVAAGHEGDTGIHASPRDDGGEFANLNAQRSLADRAQE